MPEANKTYRACGPWKNAKTVGALAVAALAVGVGSAAAIYSVVDAVLLRPLPYEHGERYVSVFSARPSSV